MGSKNDFRVSQLLRIQKNSYGTINRASDISRKKKAKFRGIFRGKFAEKSANFAGFSREKQAISWIFPGKKSKFAEKSADFVGFSREKSQNSRKNRPTSRDFKKNRPMSREISGGNFTKKQSVKNSQFRWIFWGKFR